MEAEKWVMLIWPGLGGHLRMDETVDEQYYTFGHKYMKYM
jgi:hypothetical protein